MQIEDIDDCQTAELHDIGCVQSYGALIAIDVASGFIVGCSENTGEVIGISVNQILGKPWHSLVSSDELHRMLDQPGKVRHLFWQLRFNGQDFHASAHFNKVNVIVEFEPYNNLPIMDYSSRIGFLHDIAFMKDPVQIASCLLDQVAAISGFDRVMLYRFLPDWHGLVIAEQLKPGVQGFLNLHFPAGDLPANARKLCMINMQRFVADTAAPVAGIRLTDGVAAVDLTYSQLRAVHPVHIEYLQNIGARSSFSISIMAEGKLWGMIACHNLQPAMLTFAQRFFCEELSRMTSLHISGLLALSAERHRSRMRLELAKVEAALVGSEKSTDSLIACLPLLMSAFESDSIILQVEERHHAVGAIAECRALASIQTWLGEQTTQQIWHTSKFPEFLSHAADLQKFASGLLLIPLGSVSRILLLRNEQIENQHWAGKQPDITQNALPQLTPRSSFERWTRATSATAAVWTEVQLEMATECSHSLSALLDLARIQKLAMEDSLTGLPNRRSFEKDLARIIVGNRRRKSTFAVFMMDLDKFKEVNDTLGHAAGDEVLCEVARRLKKVIREDDVLARFGGDEFALIQNNINQSGDIELVASRILQEIGKPYRLHHGTAEIGISIGIALYPTHSTDEQELLSKADTALYEVKHSGRNNWRVFGQRAMVE